MLHQPLGKSHFRESLKALEADIQHANTLAAALPRDYGGDCIQMRLSYNPFAPFLLFLIEWMDYSCMDSLPSFLGLLHILVYKQYVDGVPALSSKERKATLREFYAVIYPSLRLLGDEFLDLENKKRSQCVEVSNFEDRRILSDTDPERDDECGICMDTCTKMILPNCGHALCINCFHDWNIRSQSCPFCRGSLKRVKSSDLWVLTSSNDIIDMKSLSEENLRHLYLYIDNLPLIMPDTSSIVYDYMY